MGELSQEAIEKARRAKKRQIAAQKRAEFDFWSAPGIQETLDVGGAGLRYLDRAARLVGLGIGTAVGGGLNQLLDPFDKTPVGRWLPDLGDVPEAMQAFNRLRQQGDWDAAIEAYQDELEAGPGFWGAAEIAGAFIPTGGPFLAGGRLLGVAPGLAKTIAGVAPRVVRPGVEAGIRGGLTGAGKVLRAPWQAEEAVGRAVARGIGAVAGPVVRPLVSRFRGPGAEAVEEVVEEALGEVPSGAITPGSPFPPQWNINPVYTGPQPGITNTQRRAYQEAVELARAEGYPEFVFENPILAARAARMALPIARGKKALIDRLELETRLIDPTTAAPRLDPNIGELAKDWLEMLPDEYLDDLGSSYVNRINLDDPSMLPNMVTGGVYNVGGIIQGRRSPGIITIAKNVVNQSDIGDRTIIHEVAHHLEDFVPSRDARKLVSQWQREMRNKGESLISEVNKIRSDITEAEKALRWGEPPLRYPFLTEAEVNKVRLVYRYENFGEWFAEVLTDKALRDLYMEVPAYRNIIQKVIAQIRVMAVATRDFIAKVLGRGDEAERVYKKLISGDYSVAERRTLRSDVWDVDVPVTPDVPVAPGVVGEVAEAAVPPLTTPRFMSDVPPIAARGAPGAAAEETLGSRVVSRAGKTTFERDIGLATLNKPLRELNIDEANWANLYAEANLLSGSPGIQGDAGRLFASLAEVGKERGWIKTKDVINRFSDVSPTAARGAPGAAAREVGAEAVPPPGTPIDTPQVTAGGDKPTVISADIREGFGAAPQLSRWGAYVNSFNDMLEKLPGHPRIKPKKEPGLYEQVASAVKAKANVERQMVGHGTRLRSFIRDGKKVFGEFDENGRIMDPNFLNRAQDDIGGQIYPLTRPTIQDVAARMDTYRPFMTDEQLKFMESLRNVFENGTSWTKGGVTRAMPGWNAVLREELPRWSPNRVRTDVKPGGFYLTRGRAKPPGAVSQTGDNELLNSFTAKRPLKLTKRLIAQNRARSPSMGNAIENGVGYDTFEDAMVIHINDIAEKLAGINLGKTIGTTNRNIPGKLGRQQVGVTTAKSLAEQLELGRIPTIGPGTIIDDELVAAITKQLKEPRIRKYLDWKIIKQINQTYRGFKATYDFSALGIHGAFAAFRDPVMWGRAAEVSLRAFMRRDSIGVADAMLLGADKAAMAKGLLTSDFWSTAGLRIAAGGTEYAIPFMSRLAQGRVPVAKQAAQVFERSNLSFGVFGDALRLDWANKLLAAELRKGRTLKELWDLGEMQEMASIANKLTGWSEGRFGGDIGEVLLFAPKYFQSRLESYGQALAGLGRLRLPTGEALKRVGETRFSVPFRGRPLVESPTLASMGRAQTIQGREALRTIAQTVFFAASLTEIVNAALGNETDRRPWVDGRPNPNFYVISYGGRDFSLFGPSVGFFQAIANTVTGNFGRAMRSLGSGASRLLWDNFTGYTFSGEEAFFTIDKQGNRVFTNPARAVAYLAELVTPIAPGQAGEQLVGVAQQLPGAIRQIGGIEPEEEIVGPSPVERVIGGIVSVAAEAIGGRVSPQSRRDWENMIAKEQFGMDYDDLNNNVKPVVDKLVLQEYGEQVYRGTKGRFYKERDEINARFLNSVQDITTSWLSMGPDSEGYSPPDAKTEYRAAVAARAGSLYGLQYSPDKGRTVGGVYEYLYDRDEEREEPKPGKRGTKERKEYLLWQYYNLIPNATDANGKIDWEEFDKFSSAFWSSLYDEEVGMILANIRVIEGEMPKEMQTMLDAGRYAQAVRVDIDGQSVSFWDIEDLPEVRNAITRDAGATRAQVDKYMDATVKRRPYLEATNAIYAEIGAALQNARDLDEGVLGRKRWFFMNEAPLAWLVAMIAAGYYMPYAGDVMDALKEAGEYSTQTEQPYDRLYEQALIANR
jgi:hypothetical protein